MCRACSGRAAWQVLCVADLLVSWSFCPCRTETPGAQAPLSFGGSGVPREEAGRREGDRMTSPWGKAPGHCRRGGRGEGKWAAAARSRRPPVPGAGGAAWGPGPQLGRAPSAGGVWGAAGLHALRIQGMQKCRKHGRIMRTPLCTLSGESHRVIWSFSREDRTELHKIPRQDEGEFSSTVSFYVARCTLPFPSVLSVVTVHFSLRISFLFSADDYTCVLFWASILRFLCVEHSETPEAVTPRPCDVLSLFDRSAETPSLEWR